MKIEDYGISCSLAIRSINGVEEHGPYKMLKDIPSDFYPYIIWMSLKDHNNEEIVYIRGRDKSGDIKVQMITNSNVIDYDYTSDETLSQKIIEDLLNDIILRFKETSSDYIERLQALQKSILNEK